MISLDQVRLLEQKVENAVNKILQLQREKIYEKAAKTIKNNKVLIVCDRGMMDSKAYLSELP